VTLTPFKDGRVAISSEGFAREEEYPIERLPFTKPFGIFWAAVAYFGLHGLKVHIRSDSPVRSALGGSSTALVALLKALSKLALDQNERTLSRPDILYLGYHLEDGVSGGHCGIQDQAAAVYGGVNQWTWCYGDRRKPFRRESLLDCLTQVEKHGWGYGLIATRSLLALAADTEEDALNHLRYALEWAQSQGHIRTIIETGDELIPLLEELARKGFNPGYLGQLLAVIKGQKVSITVSRHTLIEPLSDRELEVLRLVAAGLSNREIAAKLILSLGTVKSHVHNIYGKLGVRNRTEAVTRAQEYQLL